MAVPGNRLLILRCFLIGVACTASNLWGALPADGQEAWASHPIKAIVPFPAGSAADVTARIVMERLAKRLRQPIIIENRTGASGTIGSAIVAHAKPDGYTLLVHSSSHTITGAVQGRLSFEPATDLIGVTPLSYTATAFVVGAKKGYQSLNDLVKAAKAKPGTISYASAGIGTVTHLAGESLRIAANFEATHVPYKGTVEAVTDLLAGRVDYFLAPVSIVLPYIRNGQLVALATADSARTKLLPDVPTVAEAGYPSVVFRVWLGLFAPAKTPYGILEKLNLEVSGVLDEPETRSRLEAAGATPWGMSMAEYSAMLAAEFARNAALVKKAGIKAD